MNNDWREYTGDQDYLEHHGILGQKWGVRRFENKNGHLTAAGKARYDGDKVSKKEQRAAYNKAYDKWSAGQDKNDAEYRKVQELRKGLGKTGITRTINAARNKSDAAKEYNKAYDKWSKQQDKLDKEWEDVKASKPGLTDKQKKMIIAGAAVVGTAVAAYGGYKLYRLNKQATEGLSNDYHKKATVKFTEANKLFAESEGNHSLGFKTYNNDLIKKSVEQNYKGHEKRAEAESLQDIAKSKKFSVGEKAAYLKQQNKLASEASALARSVTAEGPKSFSKPVQNAGQIKSQMTEQKMQAAQRAVSSGSKVVQSTMKIAGQEKFNTASKLNDDYVMEMLEKNKTFKF